MKAATLLRWLPVTIGILLTIGACGEPVVVDVKTGVYRAVVPSSEQLDFDAGRELPGGFRLLSDTGVGIIELRVDGDEIDFLLDGIKHETRKVSERLEIRDAEGSGPFKAEKQILVLDGGPLVLKGLTITDPVIWPGSYDGSPVVTVKERNPNERGPDVSCGPDEDCLILTARTEASGTFEDSNNPALAQNPIATIEVSDGGIEFVLDSGERVEFKPTAQSTTRACGLAETSVWEVPATVGLTMDDPVLVDTVCPSNPGAPIQLVIMERAAIPVLAPLGIADDGAWCSASRDCLWFAPT